MGGVGMGAYAASQTTVLHMKRLNQNQVSNFRDFVFSCFERQSFYNYPLKHR